MLQMNLNKNCLTYASSCGGQISWEFV